MTAPINWIDFLYDLSKSQPEKTALVNQASGARLSYKELLEAAQRWSSFLASQQVGPGDRVAFLGTNSFEHVILLFACADLGAIFVPMNYRLAPAEMQEALDRMTPQLFLTRGDWSICKQRPLPISHLRIEDLDSLDAETQRSFVRYRSSPKDPILMLFTSGSSGLPKGVLIHEEMLKANQKATCTEWGLNSEDITLVESPFFHTGGYNVLCLPVLSVGGTVIIAEKFETQKTLSTIEKGKVSVYFAVPTMFQMLKEHPQFLATDLSSVRFFVTGGAACPVELIRTYQERNIMFKQGFGLTEVGPNCFLLKESDASAKAGSIGKPMSHTLVRLIKEDGSEAEVNEVGELLMSGPHVCAGYFKDTERFEKTLEGAFFKTGDLARKDDDGFFYIVGRKKDMFISGGENVYPAEVERAINTHPEVLGSVVVPTPHPKWGEVGVAFVRSGRDIEVAELREFLNSRLSRYKQPQVVIRVQEFPLLPSGKVDKVRLSKEALALNFPS
jgi:fatty-acyl-CoA synthase